MWSSQDWKRGFFGNQFALKEHTWEMDKIPIFGGKEHPNKHWSFVANSSVMSSMIDHSLISYCVFLVNPSIPQNFVFISWWDHALFTWEVSSKYHHLSVTLWHEQRQAVLVKTVFHASLLLDGCTIKNIDQRYLERNGTV